MKLGKYKNIKLEDFLEIINKKIKKKEELTELEKNIIKELEENGTIKWKKK